LYAAYREVEVYEAKDLNEECEKGILFGILFLAHGMF
jgi:hypothetical protein